MPVPPVLANATQLAVVAAIPVTTAWLLTHAGGIGGRACQLARRLKLVPEPPARAYDPPLERIAADLRRLAHGLRTLPSGTSHVRRKGMQLAYDDTLMAACRALDVPHSLDALNLGMDRDLERIRVELGLEEAGLRFRPVPS